MTTDRQNYKAEQNSRIAVTAGIFAAMAWGSFLDIAAGIIAVTFGLITLIDANSGKELFNALLGILFGVLPILHLIAILAD